MRVAAVALVLIVGAAVVLAFANTLNSWVLGGLLGGLAAILISIPVSLALFTLLARRHDARQQFLGQPFEDEPEFAEDFYDEAMIYEAEQEADILYEDELEENLLAYREPRNYPLQPRNSANVADDLSVSQYPTQQMGSPRQRSTRSLSQHRSVALRKALQEAQQQQPTENRPSSASPSRYLPKRSLPPQRPRTGNTLRPPLPTTTGIQRPVNEQDSWTARQERVWRSMNEENETDDERFTTDRVREQYPRHTSYPRKPRASRYVEPQTGFFEEEGKNEQTKSSTQRSSREHQSGTIHNPLIRRAPYLYNDDPLRQELAQQLDSDRPITRRSSRLDQ
jgi:hypothetical protein